MPLDDNHPAEPGQYEVRYAQIHWPVGCGIGVGAGLVCALGLRRFVLCLATGTGVGVSTGIDTVGMLTGVLLNSVTVGTAADAGALAAWATDNGATEGLVKAA